MQLAPLALVCLFWSAFVWQTSFVLHGERYFTLLDDAMISMRYAKHIASGYGPVWNIGEPPVEGFTNPLLTLFMAVMHWIGLAPSKVALPVQMLGIAALALTLVANVKLLRSLNGRHRDGFAELAYILLAGT